MYKLAVLILTLVAFAPMVIAGSESGPFVSASSVKETRRQIEVLRKDDSWWTVNGKDMAWNNKNLHRLFPTVNLYREGPVRELAYRLMPEVANFAVETPKGSMAFVEFLDSDQSSWRQSAFRSLRWCVIHSDILRPRPRLFA